MDLTRKQKIILVSMFVLALILLVSLGAHFGSRKNEKKDRQTVTSLTGTITAAAPDLSSKTGPNIPEFNSAGMNLKKTSNLRRNDVTSVFNGTGQVLGLDNLGNTCYLNSLLQSLYSLEGFKKQILEEKSENFKLKSLQNIFHDMSNAADGTALNIRKDLYSLSEGVVDDVHEQNDPFDFLRMLSQINLSDNPFEGVLTSTVACPNGFQSTKDDLFDEITLPIYNQNLFNILQKHISPEILDEYTDAAKNNFINECERSITFKKLPSNLIIRLGRYRFVYDQETEKYVSEKITSDVSFDLEMDFGFITQEKTTPKKYRLNSVIVHLGSKVEGGHYVSYTRRGGRWLKFDDSYISIVSSEEMLKSTLKNAYGLIYSAE